MEVMFVLLPVALLFAAGALAVFLWAVRAGQFDDLDTPPVRILVADDDERAPGPPPPRDDSAGRGGDVRRERSRAGSRDAG